ncbi:hypothetical protein [Rugosimonospora africana]|uniref:Uncharacterized protein n=1 Tax=Rugosimonospora africana TaxID=556532 RepID=A0A8J3VRT7_9ACTN|nr:hypothetical protein [Rugosimonospora africana]GIH15733.1 hypothetical protein Raf01_39050 [Rugosimonospora africana]
MTDPTGPPSSGAAEPADQAGSADPPAPEQSVGPPDPRLPARPGSPARWLFSRRPDPGAGEAVAPERPRTAAWPGRAIRAGALVVLLLAALTMVGSALPGWRGTDDLTADLAAGRVTYIEYVPVRDTVRWVDDQVRWRQALIAAPLHETPGQPVLGREEEWVRDRIEASGHPVDLVVRNGTGNGWELWLLWVPSKPLRAAATAVWLLTLVHMLTRGGHRVANRWAWFWLFAIGQSGALLYLLLEPLPLWTTGLARRAASDAPSQTGRATGLGRRAAPSRTGRAAKPSTPIRGGTGFVYAVLLAFCSGVLSLGVAVLLR